METSTTISPARPLGLGTAKNHTHDHHHHHHHHHHHSHSPLSHHHGILSIIIIIISIIVLLAIFLIILILRRLKSARNKSSCKENGCINNNTSSRSIISHHTNINFTSSPDVKGGCLYAGNLSRATPSRYKGIQVFTYKALELATDNFSEANVIGNGRFGVVYRGKLSDGTVAAIKRLHRDGKQGERAFRTEVDLLSRLHSPFLVELLGYCADQHHRLLIFEFMPNATLQHHLHHANNQYQPLDWRTRLRIALDCATALEFLHEHVIPTVIHRDFKCTNVLLDQNLRAKVTDFGLAKMGSDNINGQISTRVMGTTGYLAPEYASTGKVTIKSDVYSFGVVLLQLLTGRRPVDTKRPPGEHVLVSWALPRLTNREKVMEMVDPTLQGQYSKKDIIQVAAIAAMCVQPEADYRPLMTDAVQSLIPLIKNFSNCITSSCSSRFQLQTASPKVLRAP